jgi:hypothetical protein
MYDKVKAWRDQFDGFANDHRSPEDYYRGMASGLNIALQEIDRERYDAEETRHAKRAETERAKHGEL